MARILVIDDDPAIRTTLRKVLEREGHSIREAPDGQAGIDEVDREAPELVIVDLIMPEKEGIETIMELRERHPELTILAISGGGLSTDPSGPLSDAKVLGADGSLAKPFTVERLIRTVDEMLNGA